MNSVVAEPPEVNVWDPDENAQDRYNTLVTWRNDLLTLHDENETSLTNDIATIEACSHTCSSLQEARTLNSNCTTNCTLPFINNITVPDWHSGAPNSWFAMPNYQGGAYRDSLLSWANNANGYFYDYRSQTLDIKAQLMTYDTERLTYYVNLTLYQDALTNWNAHPNASWRNPVIAESCVPNNILTPYGQHKDCLKNHSCTLRQICGDTIPNDARKAAEYNNCLTTIKSCINPTKTEIDNRLSSAESAYSGILNTKDIYDTHYQATSYSYCDFRGKADKAYPEGYQAYPELGYEKSGNTGYYTVVGERDMSFLSGWDAIDCKIANYLGFGENRSPKEYELLSELTQLKRLTDAEIEAMSTPELKTKARDFGSLNHFIKDASREDLKEEVEEKRDDQITALSDELNTLSEQTNPANTVVKQYVPQFFILSIAAIITTAWGILIMLLAFICMIFMVTLVIRMISIYLMAIIALFLFLFIGPLIIPALLFEQTKDIFTKWTKQIIGYALQPVILFAFVTMLFFIYDKNYFGDNYNFEHSYFILGKSANHLYHDRLALKDDEQCDTDKRGAPVSNSLKLCECDDPDSIACIYRHFNYYLYRTPAEWNFTDSEERDAATSEVDPLTNAQGKHLTWRLLILTIVCFIAYAVVGQVEQLAVRLTNSAAGGAASLSKMKTAAPHQILDTTLNMQTSLAGKVAGALRGGSKSTKKEKR